MVCLSTSLALMELLVFGELKPLKNVVAGWNEQLLRTWTLLSVLIFVDGNSYI